MTDVLFYHLTTRTLDEVLPGLVERAHGRGWRVVVQSRAGPGTDRVRDLSRRLWTFRPDAFVPHAHEGEEVDASAQPVWLTTGQDAPNDPQVRFLIDGAEAPPLDGLERAIFMFDGRDEDAVADARGEWRRQKEAGHELTYWQQDEDGRWQKKA